MIDEVQLTLFVFILARVTGFLAFNPLWGRSNMNRTVKAGLCLTMTVAVHSFSPGAAPTVPQTVLEFVVRVLLEFAVGFALGMVMQFFFYIVYQGGQLIDAQMGMNMAETYDANLGTNVSVTASLYQILLILLFFAEYGHITLFRLILTSGQFLPFGTVSFTTEIAQHLLEIFTLCVTLSIKLCFPILAAELIGQLGMGILMKVIPQINVFAINFELKILLGLAMVFLLMSPVGHFLLDIEKQMLVLIDDLLHQMAG